MASVAPVMAEASITEYARPVSGGDRLAIAADRRRALEELVCDAYQEIFDQAVAEGAGYRMISCTG